VLGQHHPLTVNPSQYPVTASANGRYLVDQSGNPFLIVGDAPHSLIANLSQNDAAIYLANRASNGFNALWVEALCYPYTGGRSDGSLLDGTLPFTRKIAGGYYDLTAPNPDYFAYVDTVLNMAGTNRLLVLLDPCETGGWLNTMVNNGSNSCWAYGQYLGNRYQSYSNLIWISGNDYDETKWSIPTNDVCVTALAAGIASVDPSQLQTVELGANYDNPDSLSDSDWWPLIQLNAVYDYSQQYAGCWHAYNRTNFLPVILAEAHYEGEVNGFPSDNVELGTPLVLRHQEYWTILSGATGQLYGNKYIWPFLSGWQTNLSTVGVRQLGYNTAFFQTRAWYNLAPDQNHNLVTAGYGTFATNGLISTNDYATSAITPDGSLAVIYLPVNTTLTVNMSALSAPASARWYDPTGGGYAAISSSPFYNAGSQYFTPPGSNGIGDPDWVLVLETTTPADAALPRFVQQNYATPQTAQAQIAVTYPTAQTTGNVNIVAIGWGDTTAGIGGVTDSVGNLYQVAVPVFRGNGASQAIYYAIAIAGGSNTVTVQFDRPASFVDFRVTEYAGLSQSNVLDSVNSASGAAPNADSGSVTTTSDNDLIFGAGYTLAGFSAPGAGFAQRVLTTPDGDNVEDEVVAALGSYDATAACSGPWLLQVAAFRAAPSSLTIVPQITGMMFNNNIFIVQFSTVVGQTYELDSAPDLTSGAWHPVVAGISGSGGIVQAVDTNAVNRIEQFYRVKTGL
jgi:hypothetical protein